MFKISQIAFGLKMYFPTSHTAPAYSLLQVQDAAPVLVILQTPAFLHMYVSLGEHLSCV